MDNKTIAYPGDLAGAGSALEERAPGDHGTFRDAVDFAIDELPKMRPAFDAVVFLTQWREGDLAEWPEFYSWLAARSALNQGAEK